MTPSEWQIVKRVFDLAIDQPAEAQSAMLADLPEPPRIKAEVRRLLRSLASSDGFLQEPAIDLHDLIGAEDENPVLSAGALVARRFEIKRFLNRGGMGEVYEAWDLVLRETVALKTIRPRIAQRPEVIERFKREVRHSRELSHPNICRVHELFAHEAGPDEPTLWVLSMELLDGPTLRECLHDEGPMEPKRAFEIARQLIAGLDAAHQHGLVHRDFKSANVMLVQGNGGRQRAVITDFGLSARLTSDEDAPVEAAGVGTPGYMAPEQETGGAEVGPLADQYALGAVLCEMLTGELPLWVTPQRRKPARREPFASERSAHTDKRREQDADAHAAAEARPARAGKRNAQIRVLRLPEHRYPPRWEDTIRCCMQREPAERFRNVQEVAKSLTPPGLLGTPWRKAIAAVLVVAASAGAWQWQRMQGRCLICDVTQLTPDSDQSESPSLSRDGKMIAYSSDRVQTGNLDIFVQSLPGGRPIRITHDAARDGDPSLAPDGSFVVFRSERDGGGLYLANTNGGPERLIAQGGRNPQVAPDGKSLLYWVGLPDPSTYSGHVFRMTLPSGPTLPVAADFMYARTPLWSADGKDLLFTGCKRSDEACPDLWVSSPDGRKQVKTGAMSALQAAGVAVLSFGSGAWHGNELVFSGNSGFRTNLYSLPLKLDRWIVSKPPRPLLVEDANDLSPTLAQTGEIAYTSIAGALHIWRIQHATEPRNALLEKVTGETELDGTPFVSAGGRYLVFARSKGGAKRSIWLRDTATSAEAVLLDAKIPIQNPIIDRDGKWIAFDESRDGVRVAYAGPRSGPYRTICSPCMQASGWFDGDRSFFLSSGMPSAIAAADPRSGAVHTILSRPGVSLGDATWSAANGLMLFTATADGHKRVFAVRLSGETGEPVGPWIPLLTEEDNPDHPRWSGDGKTIFYVSRRDSFQCVYGRRFSAKTLSEQGSAFPVMHFHQARASIENVSAWTFNLSAADDSLYLTLGEQNSTIRTGRRVND